MSTHDTQDCPLSDQEQTRNLLIFGANWSLTYLAAPAVYIGVTQAALCERLGMDEAASNLPSSIYLSMAGASVLIAWYFPKVRQLKPILVVSCLMIALGGLIVSGSLLVSKSEWVYRAILLHALTVGIFLTTINTFQWEMVRRGVSTARRGQVLGVAFGVGPLFAVVSSLASQALLGGKLLGSPLEGPPFRWYFAVLFGASAPLFALMGLLCSRYVVNLPREEPQRQPFVAGVFGGMGEFFGTRLILITVIAMILVNCGQMVMPNISLYTFEVTGKQAQAYAGYQLALRFGFKVVAGFCMGWLLMRTHPKATMLSTVGLCMAGVAWALVARGEWYLLSFGLMGAGELMGVYYPNYILYCSSENNTRRNMAFANMVIAVVAVAPLFYGLLTETFGTEDKTRGFHVSFIASLVLLGTGMLLVTFLLPARPTQSPDVVEND